MPKRFLLLLLFLLSLASAAAASSLQPSAVPVDPQPRYVAASDPSDLVLASDGDGYLAVWVDSRGGLPSVRARRLSSTAEAFDYSGIDLGQIDFEVWDDGLAPSVVWNGQAYQASWIANGGLMVAMVAQNGHVRRREIYPLPPGGVFSPVALASDGTRSFAIVDIDHRLYGRLFDSSGASLSGWFPIAGRGQAFPAVGWNGREYLVVWGDWNDGYTVVYGARFTSSGEQLDLQPIEIGRTRTATGYSYPDVAWDGDEWTVVWTASGVRLNSVTPSGVVGTERELSPEENRVHVTEVAAGAFVSWNRMIDEPGQPFGRGSEINLALVSRGVGDVVPVHTGYVSGRSPAVSNGSSIIVVAAAIYKAFDALYLPPASSLAEAVKDSRPFLLSIAASGQQNPVALASPESFLVTWNARLPHWRNSSSDSVQLVASGIAEDETLLGPPNLLAEELHAPTFVSGAFARDRYLLIWNSEETWNADTTPVTTVMGVFVGRAGNPLGTAFPLLTTPSDTRPTSNKAAIVSDGEGFLLVYEGRGPADEPRIVAQRIGMDGTKGEEKVLVAAPFAPYEGLSSVAIAADMAHGRLAVGWWPAGAQGHAQFAEFSSSLQPLSAPVALPENSWILSTNVGRNSTLVTIARSSCPRCYLPPTLSTVIVDNGIAREVRLPALGSLDSASAAATDNEFSVGWIDSIFANGVHHYSIRVAHISETGEIRSIDNLGSTTAGFHSLSLAYNGRSLMIAYGKIVNDQMFGAANRIFVDVDPVPQRRRQARRR